MGNIDGPYLFLILLPMRIKDLVYVYRLQGGERHAWHVHYYTHDPGDWELHYFVKGQGAFLLNRSRRLGAIWQGLGLIMTTH